MLGAGDLLAAGTDKPETWDAILYATSNEYAVAMANGHAELSPRNDIDAVVDHRSAAGVVRRTAGELGDLPLRRCRHDARRGRVRHVLDGGDGVDRRWQHRGHARQHRGQLARLMTSTNLKRDVRGVGAVGSDPSRVLRVGRALG